MRRTGGGAGPEDALTGSGPGAPDPQTLNPTVPRLVTSRTVLSRETATQRVTGRSEVGVAPTATSSCLQNSSGQAHAREAGRARQKAKSMASGAKVSSHRKWDAGRQLRAPWSSDTCVQP